jgi:DICT domain-containing protein
MPDAKQPFHKLKIDDAELARIVQTSPELVAKVGTQHRLFTLGDAAQAQNKAREEPAGVLFSHLPIVWSPEDGARYVVVTGRGKSSAYVAAFSVDGDNYKIVSYFVFQNETTPVVLAYKEGRRKELFWTSCWACPGDQGQVSFRDDKRIVIVQQ